MKKIIFTLILTLALILGCGMSVFASEKIPNPSEYLEGRGVNVENFNIYYNAYPTDSYTYTIVQLANNTNYYVVIAPKGCTLVRESTVDKVNFRIYNKTSELKHYYIISVNDIGNIGIIADKDIEVNDYWTMLKNDSGTFDGTILYSDVTIYNDVDKNSVFLNPLLTNPTLQAVVRETQMKGVLKQLIGLIPLAIGLIISVVGLRKALTLLQTVLHQA